MPKVKLSLGIGLVNAKQKDEIYIDDEEWDECETEDEREKLLDEIATEWAWNYIDLSAEVEE